MPASPELKPVQPQEQAAEKEETRPDVLEGGEKEIDPRIVIDMLSTALIRSKEIVTEEKTKLEALFAQDKTQAYSENKGKRYNQINYEILPNLDAKIEHYRAMADEMDAAGWENMEFDARRKFADNKGWEEAEWTAKEWNAKIDEAKRLVAENEAWEEAEWTAKIKAAKEETDLDKAA